MVACTLQYIPEILHTNDRQPIEVFTVGEFMYRRCKPEYLDNPFGNINLTELSHNRSGFGDQILSDENDVLYSIKIYEEIEIYNDQQISTLEIISLNQENKYCKIFEQMKDGNKIIARMDILHDPEPCMLPHCIFRIWVGDDKITSDNYKVTLKKFNEIRNKIREELTSMIIKERCQNNFPI